MKLTAPSKDSLIYRVVAWLNGKATQYLCGDYSEVKAPKTSCSLGWQAILWWVIFLNVITVPLVVLDLFIGSGDIVNNAMATLVTGIGAIAGMFIALVLLSVYLLITSLGFWVFVFVYLNVCLVHKLMSNYDWTVGSMNFNKVGDGDHFVFRGLAVVFFLITLVCTKTYKLLSKYKFNISCEDIK